MSEMTNGDVGHSTLSVVVSGYVPQEVRVTVHMTKTDQMGRNVHTAKVHTYVPKRLGIVEDENAKLRELVIDLHLTADEFSEKYERPFYVDKFLFRRDHINDRMRELGIEVK